MATSSKHYTVRNISLTFFLLFAATNKVVSAQSFDMAVDHKESDILSPSTLVQVHVIARHGARSQLSKNHDSLAEEGGANLTPLGQKQLFELGSWLKDQYGVVLGGPANGESRSLDYYNPNLHRFESSNLDRTLSSANAVAMGLFPSKTRASGSKNIDPTDPSYQDMLYETYTEAMPAIPVYTSGKEVNDVTLRAYKNCPTFKDRLSQLYNRPEWKKMEKDNEDLLVKLATLYPSKAVNGKIPLTEIWNVYDAVHVAKTECIENSINDSTFACSSFLTTESVVTANSLTTDEFGKVEMLAEHIEFIKYGAGLDTPTDTGHITAGTLLGSNLLRKILNRSMGGGDFFFYSAHAPTILGFLATLQATRDFVRDTEGEKFIEYGSALIVEIHRSSEMGKHYFVLKYKNSDSPDSFHVIMKMSTTGIECGKDDSGLPNVPKASWCLLDEVTAFAKTYAMTSDEAWCKACNNQEADVCIPRKNGGTPRLDAWMVSSGSMGYTGSTGASWIICALFFGGFLTGVAVMALVWCCRERRNDLVNTKNGGVIGSGHDSTESYISNEVNESPVVITNMDMDDAAEKLNNKEIC